MRIYRVVRTARILGALGQQETLLMLAGLLRTDMRQSELVEEIKASGFAEFSQSTASKSLTRLEDLGLVVKQSQKGPYSLVDPVATRAFLDAALALTRGLSGKEEAHDGHLRSAMRDLLEVGDPGFEPGTSSLSETRSNRLS
jgi:hypothetical protein